MYRIIYMDKQIEDIRIVVYTAEDLKCRFFYKINLKKKYYNILTMNSKRSMMTCSCSSCFSLIKRACKVGIIKDTH
jgi:hypothetical protein